LFYWDFGSTIFKTFAISASKEFKVDFEIFEIAT
jgi:hypothetical protein